MVARSGVELAVDVFL